MKIIVRNSNLVFQTSKHPEIVKDVTNHIGLTHRGLYVNNNGDVLSTTDSTILVSDTFSLRKGEKLTVKTVTGSGSGMRVIFKLRDSENLTSANIGEKGYYMCGDNITKEGGTTTYIADEDCYIAVQCWNRAFGYEVITTTYE